MLEYAILLIFLGIANWLLTTVLVEAEVTRDYRDWIGGRYARSIPVGAPDDYRPKWSENRQAWAWYKLKYLVGCHLCTGTWVGLVTALFIPPIVHVPLVGFLLTAFAIKGIGHLFLVLHKAGEAFANHHNAKAMEIKAIVASMEKRQNERAFIS